VTTNYVGANADTVEKAVTIPLEEAINGVEGMRYISSSSTNSGTSPSPRPSRPATTSTSRPWTCRIAWPACRAPARGGQRHRHHITKANFNFVFGAGFYTRRRRYSPEFISNYLDVYVKDALKRVPGVGDVMIFGERKYAMRVWLDPVRLAARGLTATDVVNALVEQNVEIPAGQLGQPPSDQKQAFQIPVRVVGRLTSPEFDNIIVKNSANGLVLLKDVGHSGGRRGLQHQRSNTGARCQWHRRQQLSNANALDVDRQAKAALAELSKSFPPGLNTPSPLTPPPWSATRSAKCWSPWPKPSSSSSRSSSSSCWTGAPPSFPPSPFRFR
jgi:hydrophobic/amphiphilic exporter-1 (mainly G- bacteria), HAE1 family